GRHVLSGSNDGTLRVWNISEERAALRTILDDSPSRFEVITFSPDGRFFATGTQDQDAALATAVGVIRLREAATGRVVTERRCPDSSICSLIFDPSGQRLAAGTWRGAIHQWDIHSGQLIFEK